MVEYVYTLNFERTWPRPRVEIKMWFGVLKDLHKLHTVVADLLARTPELSMSALSKSVSEATGASTVECLVQGNGVRYSAQ